jgi:hypothetical protein
MLLIEAVANSMIVMVAMVFVLIYGMRGLEWLVDLMHSRTARDAARRLDDELPHMTD